ncbi:MAG: 16S rRNA processing protein RimM [Candidatus Zixiibacteriota bacterium]|nr:MAG: 16S rRNA processing protein RimM [candidate division Zixibacteria bacterium]
MGQTDPLIEVARIIKPQGLKGELKVLPYSRDPQDLKRYQTLIIVREGGRRDEYTVERFRIMTDYVILKLTGVNDRDQAEEFRDLAVMVRPEQLPEPGEGEYFIRDLIGLQVFSEQGEPLGELADVLELPAHDVYQVISGARELLIPAIADVVQEINLERRVMIVRLLDGLLDLP